MIRSSDIAFFKKKKKYSKLMRSFLKSLSTNEGFNTTPNRF